MKLEEYQGMVFKLKKTEFADNKGVLPALLLLLDEARQLLFPEGEYKKLKWHQISRVWRMAKFAVRLITTLITIFK